MTLDERFRDRLAGTRTALQSLERQLPDIITIATTIRDGLAHGHLVLTAGNGGSAAQALHLAEELIGRYRGDRPAQRAVCLAADPTALTCIANDFGYEEIFARPCQALAGRDDLVVGLTTSGRSENIVRLLTAARQRGARTIGLLGGDGGPSHALCDESIVIEGDDSAHIQEAHQVAIHLICEAVEQG